MIDCELIQEMFDYLDGELIWKNTPRGRNDRAGHCTCSKTYKVVTIFGKKYPVHRIVFLLHNGYMPEYVDHINGNRLDNRIENLRECTKAENSQNMTITSRNTSGVKGVSWHSVAGKWQAKVMVAGVNHHLGLYDTLLEAESAIIQARSELHKEFARHT